MESTTPNASAPVAEAATLSQKPQVNSSEAAERKSEVNGNHSVTPESKSEPKPESTTEKPVESRQEHPEAARPVSETTVLSNGDAATEHKATNGVSDAPLNKPETADVQTTTTEVKQQPETVKSAEESTVGSAPTSSDDIQMQDAAPVKPAAAAEPSTSTPAADSKPADTKMEDEDKAPIATTTTSQEDTSSSVAAATSDVDLQPVSISQLALETQPDDSTVLQSVEVNMTDAPPSNKIAREREDDDESEEARAAKRARTEPEEEREQKPVTNTTTTTTTTTAAAAAATDSEIKADASSAAVEADSIVASTSQPDVEAKDPASMHKWEDPEANARTLSYYRRREIRKIIGRIKKTKGGANFKDGVAKLWPALAEAYLAKIDKPMDLSELERNLREENVYPTLGNFKNDLVLVYMNALNFNGAAHDVTASAFAAVKTIWEDSITLPEEEPSRPKPLPKAKPLREVRAIPESSSRRQSAAPGETAAAGSSKTQDDNDRRGSTDIDRPKRNVRAPKPKDIDYTTKPSRKKLKPELQFCFEVMAELMHPKNETLIEWFKVPVDAEGLNIPHYYSTIKKPMDLGKVNRMLQAGEFTSLKDFDKNVQLIFDNCYQFNGPVDQGNVVSLRAKELEKFYNNLMKGKDAWIAKHVKANAPAVASNDSDEDEEDEDEDMDDAPGVDNSKEIQELNAKLSEETAKLHAMFVPGANQSLIDIQKGIVDMVQAALMKTVASSSEAQPKANKKAPKAAKAKGPGGRKAQAGQTKKTPGPKKGAAKKSLTAADKDSIANAINDLEYPHLDRAIDIIKKDTGQNENNDGELELDIDQLSNDALLKLWDLCKKALPGFAKDSAPSAPEPKAPKAPRTSSAGKPKKNKPMSAQEQEARIAQLTALRQMYKDGQEPSDLGGGGTGSMLSPPLADSSDDSDSEEE